MSLTETNIDEQTYGIGAARIPPHQLKTTNPTGVSSKRYAQSASPSEVLVSNMSVVWGLLGYSLEDLALILQALGLGGWEGRRVQPQDPDFAKNDIWGRRCDIFLNVCVAGKF